MTAFWLSFASEAGFLGGCIVEGETLGEAVLQAHRLGINPGGEVEGYEIPPHLAALTPARWRNRLLSREDCDELDRDLLMNMRK